MGTSVVAAHGHEQTHRRLQIYEVQRRVDFLGNHLTLTCAAARLRLQASGLSAKDALTAVRVQKAVFYVQFVDVAHFPAFQWKHVTLRRVIAEVLTTFDSCKSKWQTALWFAEPHGLLSCRPLELLDDDPDAILYAARRDVGAIGRNH